VGADAIAVAAGPIPYRLRRSRRATRLTLRVVDGQVRVTAPPHVPERHIRAFVESSRTWIARAVADEAARRAPGLVIGDRIPFLDGTVLLEGGGARGPRRDADRLRVPGAVVETGSLERWYRAEARRHFAALADRWAPVIAVQPSRLVIRDQRTRWGSASARGTLSLNWRLMMAPARIGEYVVVHELVHFHHMDHSRAFWDRVADHWPGYQADRAWLQAHGPALHAGPRPVGPGDGERRPGRVGSGR
jgi:predicted metal-dependent hydrolase